MCDDFDGGNSDIDTSFSDTSIDTDFSDTSFDVDSVIDTSGDDFGQFEVPAEIDGANIVPEVGDGTLAEPIEGEFEQLEVSDETGMETTDDISDINNIMDAGEDDFEQFEIPVESQEIDEPILLEPDEVVEIPHDTESPESIETIEQPIEEITPEDIQSGWTELQQEGEQDAAALDDRFVEQTEAPNEIEEQIAVADAVAVEETEGFLETDTDVESESDTVDVDQVPETSADTVQEIQQETDGTADAPADTESQEIDEPILLEPDEVVEISHDTEIPESVEASEQPIEEITPEDIQSGWTESQQEGEQDAAALDDRFVEQTDAPNEIEEQIAVADAVAVEETEGFLDTDTDAEPESDAFAVEQVPETSADTVQEIQQETDSSADALEDTESLEIDEPILLEPDEVVEIPHDTEIPESVETIEQPIEEITPEDIQSGWTELQQEGEQDAAALDDRFVEQTDAPNEIEEQIAVADAVAVEETEGFLETDTDVEPESDIVAENQVSEVSEIMPEREYDDFEQTILVEDPEFYEPGRFFTQGINEYGYEGTCGPTSQANALNKVLGTNEFTENKILSVAVDNNLCDTSGFPEDCGGTTTEQFLELYEKVNEQTGGKIETELFEYDNALGLEDVAAKLDEGAVLNVAVDSKTLWGEQREFTDPAGGYVSDDFPSDHWITVTGAQRNELGNIQGFDIIDSGGGVDYVTAEHYQEMCFGTEEQKVLDPTCIVISKKDVGDKSPNIPPELPQAAKPGFFQRIFGKRGDN